MANFHGKDGSITVGAVALDQVIDWSLDDVAVIEVNTTKKGDIAALYEGGLVESGRWRAVCNLDYVTAQQDIMDLIVAGTGTVLAVVLLVGSGKSFAFNSVPPKFSISSPAPESTEPVRVTFDGKVSGVVTIAWA